MSARPPGCRRNVASSICSTDVEPFVRSTRRTRPHEPWRSLITSDCPRYHPSTMAEYDLVCDSCGKTCEPADAMVSWTASGDTEGAFALTHAAHVPSGARERVEARKLVWPNEYLGFVSARLGKRIA